MDKQDMNRLRRFALKFCANKWQSADCTVVGDNLQNVAITRSHEEAQYIAAAQPSAILALLDKVEALEKERDELAALFAESRANDSAAMGYLSQVRKIVGGDDFPAVIDKVRELAQPSKEQRDAE